MDRSRQDFFRAVAAMAVVAAMLAVWAVVRDEVVIFPELGALAVGLLLLDKAVWRVSKVMCVVVMTVSAAIGVLSQVVLAGLVGADSVLRLAAPPFVFLLIGILLFFCRAFLAPAFSAGLLPVLLGISSWVYVGVVASSVVTVLAVQWLLEVAGVRRYRMPLAAAPADAPVAGGPREWLVLSLCIVPPVVAGWASGWLFVAAPPLIVTFVEFALGGSGFRSRPWQVLFMLVFGAAVGSVSVIIFCSLGYGLVPAGLCAALAMLLIFYLFRKAYAPAVSVALLALLTRGEAVWTYPFQVALGAAYAIVASSLPYMLFPREKA